MKRRVKAWLRLHRLAPVIALVASENFYLTWKGWDSWLWFGPVVASLYVTAWLLATLREPEPKLPARTPVFTCPDCGQVLYPEALVRPIMLDGGRKVCPNCYATVESQ